MTLSKRQVKLAAAAHAAEAVTYAHADGQRVEIALPRLCGARAAADALVSRIAVDLTGKIVVLNARLTTVGTEAYADELTRLLALAGAEGFELTPTTAEFERSLKRSAKLRRLPFTLLG